MATRSSSRRRRGGSRTQPNLTASDVRACMVRTSQKGPFQLNEEQCAKFRPGARLGSGAYAVAYERKGDPTRVAKFTTDKKDAKSAALLKGKKYKHLVRVEDVRELRGHPGVYGIIAERLKTGDTLDDVALNILREALADHAHFRGTGEIDADEPLSSLITDDAYKLCKWNEPYTAWASRRSSDKAKRCDSHLRQMVTAIDEAIHAGLLTRDLHQGNWGMRDKDHVILDFGHSTTFHKDAPAIDLAGLRRRRRKKR